MTPALSTSIGPMLTTRDCAAMLQVRPETIIEWAKLGRFPNPAVNGYRCKRWHRSQVEKFLTTGRVR